MRILLLTDGVYPYVGGGMARHSYYLAKHLTLQGASVHLVHCHYGEGIPEINKGRDDFGSFNLNKITFKLYPFPEKGSLPGHYIRANEAYSKQIYSDLASQLAQYDVIYAQGLTGREFIRQRKNGKIKSPVFVNLHGYEMFQRPADLKQKVVQYMLRGSVKWLSLNADYVFSFGARIKDILDKIGVPGDRQIEVPLGIESDWLFERPGYSGERELQFVFVGRYERRKGIEELNEALSALLQQKGLPLFKFHFLGPIPPEKQIDHAAVVYHGQVNKLEQVQTLLRSTDVLVCPSYAEGMPTVILEAMASGNAIIGTDVGAVSREIEGNGILLPSPEPSQIQDAMIRILNMGPASIAEMQKCSFERVRNLFTWDTVIHPIIQALEQGQLETQKGLSS